MVDVNKSVSNPKLLDAIKNMQETNSVDSKNSMVEAVLNAHFLSPVSIEPTLRNSENGVVTLEKETIISFNMLTDSNGKTFYPIFTDWVALQKWEKNEGQQTIITTFSDISSIILKNQSEGFAINPYSDNIRFEKVFIQHIVDEIERRKNGGVVEKRIEKETKVMLGQPNNYPHELVNAITAKLKKITCVKAAYLFLMINSDDNEQSYLIVVDFDGDRREVFDNIGKTAMPYLNGMYLDMVPATDEFVIDSIKSTKPFYKKKIWGIF